MIASCRATARVTLHNVALSNESGMATFYVAGRGSQQDQLHAPPWAALDSATRGIEVPVRTLDETLGSDRRVAFAKVDAQGHDAQVLRGARRLIESGRMPLFLFEVAPGLSPNAVHEYVQTTRWLARTGFDCFDCDEDSSRRSTQRAQRDGRRMPLEVRMAELAAQKELFKGAHHGGYTNFVCQQRRTLAVPGALGLQRA